MVQKLLKLVICISTLPTNYTERNMDLGFSIMAKAATVIGRLRVEHGPVIKSKTDFIRVTIKLLCS